MSFETTAKEMLVAEIEELVSNVSNVLTKGILEQCNISMLRRIERNLSLIYEEIHS